MNFQSLQLIFANNFFWPYFIFSCFYLLGPLGFGASCAVRFLSAIPVNKVISLYSTYVCFVFSLKFLFIVSVH